MVELTCKAISRGHILEMCMNCLDTDVQTDMSNNNTYVAKLSKRVKSSDNGTLCTCKLSSVITRSSSIKLHIISKYMFPIDTLCGASLPAQRQSNFIWYFYMFFILSNGQNYCFQLYLVKVIPKYVMCDRLSFVQKLDDCSSCRFTKM